MKNNPVIAIGLPRRLFQDLIALRQLSMSGQPPCVDDVALLGALSNLEEIVLTPGRQNTYGIEKLPNIQKVYFYFCQFGSTLTRSLEVIDGSGIGLTYVKWTLLVDSKVLRILYLARNFLGAQSLTPFPALSTLEELDLSNNHINHLPLDMFASLMSLRHLNIANNELHSLDILFPASLQTLDLSGNLLSSLDSTATARIDELPAVLLYLHSNPLQCDCSKVEFLSWYHTTSTKIHGKELLTCLHGATRQRMSSIRSSQLKHMCGLTVNTVAITSVACCLLIVSMVTSVLVYR
jgi:Leucine-rich repeat (LRR) protein